MQNNDNQCNICLLYTSDAADDMQGLDKKFVGIEKIYKEVSMK